ncbi:macrophage mannose receptor 1-like [Gigantopelta aegis]|uniref:macrophage mannose receptor 1-like n=1 Tax=Gigantopelta aegis TaxID=1735272 RepID=UPI001B88966F|nr:macrophage mannose receptor 1-like [Gigantopelta aegis]
MRGKIGEIKVLLSTKKTKNNNQVFFMTSHCPSPPVVINATANFTRSHETTKVGSCLSYTCDVNFHPVGNRTCLPDGTWSNFTCEPDPCPVGDGFVFLDRQHLCFKVFEDKDSAYGGRRSCKRLGAKLIVVDTEMKNTAVSEYVNSTLGSDDFWIGLKYEQNDNRYVWENGNEATFTNWASGQPRGGNQDCVLLLSDSATWKDYDCAYVFRYICEKQLST